MNPKYKCPKCGAEPRLLDTRVAPTPDGRLGATCPGCGELLAKTDWSKQSRKAKEKQSE